MVARQLSVVIPLYKEAESLSVLYQRLAEAMRNTQADWELVFVDDGSHDGTWEQLAALHQADPRVRAIRFARNFGQTAAMACGVEAARGELIVTMDGDLQNDPADIPKLLAKLDEGYDVVCGWRYRRQDKLLTRKIPSVVANRLIGLLTGVKLHDYGCSLKAYRAEAIKRTPLYAELHRFIPAMATLTGSRIAEVKVTHHPRQYGWTKYTLWRTWKVAFDMVTVSLLVKFASKPLRLFGLVGLGCLIGSSIAALRAISWNAGSVSNASLVMLEGGALLGIWLGGHLLVVGCLAELCLATAHTRPEQLLAPVEGGE